MNKKRQIVIRKNSRPYNILNALALGTGILVIGTLAPASGAVMVREIIKTYFRKKRFEKDRFLRDLKTLQKRELLTYKELPDGTVEIEITKQGKNKILRYRVDEIQLKKPDVWDKKWRLVIFDVPHAERQARDALREKLQDMKFYQLQKSVFLTPYPCEDEIDFIASIFDVRRHILILYIQNFEGEEKLKHFFNI